MCLWSFVFLWQPATTDHFLPGMLAITPTPCHELHAIPRIPTEWSCTQRTISYQHTVLFWSTLSHAHWFQMIEFSLKLCIRLRWRSVAFLHCSCRIRSADWLTACVSESSFLTRFKIVTDADIWREVLYLQPLGPLPFSAEAPLGFLQLSTLSVKKPAARDTQNDPLLIYH